MRRCSQRSLWLLLLLRLLLRNGLQFTVKADSWEWFLRDKGEEISVHQNSLRNVQSACVWYERGFNFIWFCYTFDCDFDQSHVFLQPPWEICVFSDTVWFNFTQTVELEQMKNAEMLQGHAIRLTSFETHIFSICTTCLASAWCNTGMWAMSQYHYGLNSSS